MDLQWYFSAGTSHTRQSTTSTWHVIDRTYQRSQPIPYHSRTWRAYHSHTADEFPQIRPCSAFTLQPLPASHDVHIGFALAVALAMVQHSANDDGGDLSAVSFNLFEFKFITFKFFPLKFAYTSFKKCSYATKTQMPSFLRSLGLIDYLRSVHV